MKLSKVTIFGFRSIKYMEIPFEGYGHKILVGKNESGKSNILKALQLLSGGTFKKNQEKISFDNEEEDSVEEESSVIFQFELEQDESTKCKDVFAENFFAIPNTKLTNKHTIESFYNEYSNVLYAFDIDQEGRWTQWKFPKDIQIANGWHLVNPNIANGMLTGHDDIPVGSYIHDNYIKKVFLKSDLEALHNCLSKIDAESIRDVLHNVIKLNLALGSPPISTVYWEYSSKDCDLPPSVDMDAFSADPDSCKPLRDMFLLAGHKKDAILKEISEAKTGGLNNIRNLLNDISRKATIHIKKNWQEYNEEYGDVEIELRESGTNIAIAIKDSKNLYSLEQRSDGFRRFISFLLLMTHTSNSLILLDEPETGLHPSSAMDLRNVLINLGKKNTVVYATHSISMIDTENVENNLVIFKESEDTFCKVEKEDGSSSGELIYNAIGYSIYNELKKNNILLEGYTDKKILKSFMQGPEWKDFGICYTSGVNNIEKVVQFLELGGRKYFILFDADSAATQSKKKNNFKPWYTYTDLDSNAITLEDFYMKEFLNDTTKSVLEKHSIDTQIFSLNDIADNNRMNLMKEQLKQMISLKQMIPSTKKSVDEILKEIKQECANNATPTEIDEEKLTPVLEKFLEKIKGDAT